ncbi:MAG: hypothetical protein J7647_16625 [Cyanobacteria bacterium SBLK]|nr:hypothetical protein [Cyanobacteria bacterium SBLK]
MADFFLEPDEAKTLGDIEYMRQPNTVTRTFPGNVANGGSFSVTKQVNAMEEKVMDARSGFSPAPASEPKASAPTAPKTTPSRPVQSSGSVDFLKMAKGMRR